MLADISNQHGDEMTDQDFGGEQPANFEPKCPCILVLDVSGSMSGPPVQQLNAGLRSFHSDVLNSSDPITPNRLEVGIVTFDSNVVILQQPALVDSFTMPTLVAGSSTKLVDGVRAAIKLAVDRKSWYKSTGQDYYRPYVILVTDGQPDADQDVGGLAQEIRRGVDGKNFVFWAFGTDGADMEKLRQIAHPKAPPEKFSSANFLEFFKWLSKSMGLIANSREDAVLNLAPDNPSLFQHKV